jgi:hypothetical protein
MLRSIIYGKKASGFENTTWEIPGQSPEKSHMADRGVIQEDEAEESPG